MNLKQFALALVLLPFLALSGYVIATIGFQGFYEAANANPSTRLMMFDLTIVLSLMSIWMYLDARERPFSAIPYIVVCALIGAAGPLLYLIRREAGLRGREPAAGARRLAA